jgi:hypothetical protein
VAIASSGDVYVADTYNDDVQRLDRSGVSLAMWQTGHLTFPTSVTSATGGVYVIEGGKDRVDL